MITSFSPKVRDIRHPRTWLKRQVLNAKIGLEYFKYRRKLSGVNLQRYHFSGPQMNDHVKPLKQATLDKPLRIFGFWRHVSWENFNLLPALQTYGDVVHYDPQADYDPYSQEYDLSAKHHMQEKVWHLIVSEHAKQPWDILFFYVSAATLEPPFIQKLRALEIPMVNFSHDDIISFEDRKSGAYYRGTVEIAQYFTVYCVTSVIGFQKALAVGATPYYLPGGANPQTYRRLSGIQRDLDVVLVGARFYDRGEVIEYLQNHGIQVEAHGYGWPRGSVTNQQQIELLNRAKIVLGFNRYSGSDWMGIKGRDHEVPMTGAFHLVNDFPEMRNIYAPGGEVGVYRNERDLVDQIRYYLSEPEKRERIAEAGWHRAHRDHTWQVRFGDLFARLGLISPITHQIPA